MDILCEQVLNKLRDDYKTSHNKTIDVTAYTGLEHQALKVLQRDGFLLIKDTIADFVTLTDKAL